MLAFQHCLAVSHDTRLVTAPVTQYVTRYNPMPLTSDIRRLGKPYWADSGSSLKSIAEIVQVAGA
jgi:hypothetical protein